MKYLKLLLTLLMLNTFLYASEQTPTQEEVAKLYVATFNRAPDSVGLNYWVNDSFDGHPTLSGIAQSFFDAPETQALYPAGTTVRAFIESVYQNLFNRAPDRAGLSYWEDDFNLRGRTRDSFILAMINGAQDSADGMDITILNNKNEVGLYFTNAGLGENDFPTEVMSGVTSSSDTVSFIKGKIDSGDITPNNWSEYTGNVAGTISGTAATGKALSNATIYLKDSRGTVVSTIADADGKFSFDTTNLTPPFYLRTQGYGLFSFTDQQSGTANLTPLTTAVVAIANNGDPDIYTYPISDPSISDAKTNLKSFLTDGMLQKYGVSDADPVSTSFDADGTGMDALLDSIYISIDSANSTIEIKNPFTDETIGTGTFSDGNVSESDPVEPTEADSLPQSVTYKKYFGYNQDDYGSHKDGPGMTDIVEDSSGKLSVTITATDGYTGDLFLIYGVGIKSGNEINFTVPVILCEDTDPNGTGTAVFSGTIDSNGDVSGTFINTLSAGDTCKVNNSSTYTGTFRADDVTNAQPVNAAGTYDSYATYKGWQEDGPNPIEITQDGSTINVSITGTDYETGQQFTRTGSGTVYGNYIMFQVPLITCHDTDPYAQDENAIIFAEANSDGSFTGIVGAGIPPGDYCKAYDYNQTGETISAVGDIRGVKK